MNRSLSSLLFVLLAAWLVSDLAFAQRGGRLAPPAALACDRNQLTSFEGVLIRHESKNGMDHVTLETDWGSEERFVVDTTSEPPHYLVNGEPAEDDTWQELLPGCDGAGESLRLIAWVCSDPEQVVIDWRPSGDS